MKQLKLQFEENKNYTIVTYHFYKKFYIVKGEVPLPKGYFYIGEHGVREKQYEKAMKFESEGQAGGYIIQLNLRREQYKVKVKMVDESDYIILLNDLQIAPHFNTMKDAWWYAESVLPDPCECK